MCCGPPLPTLINGVRHICGMITYAFEWWGKKAKFTPLWNGIALGLFQDEYGMAFLHILVVT